MTLLTILYFIGLGLDWWDWNGWLVVGALILDIMFNTIPHTKME